MRDAVIVSTARTPIGKAYRGAFNATPAPTLAAHAIRAAVERAGIEAGRDRRLSARLRRCRRGPAHDRPHGGPARRPAGDRARHDARPPMLLRPDGDRDRRQAGHRRPHGRGPRRRRGIDLAGPDGAAARRPRSRLVAMHDDMLHADDGNGRDGRRSDTASAATGRTLMPSIAAAHRRRHNRPAASTTRSCPSPPDDGRRQGPQARRREPGDDARPATKATARRRRAEGLAGLKTVRRGRRRHRRQCQPAVRRCLGLHRHGGRPGREARPATARPLCRHGGGRHQAGRDGHRPGLRRAAASRAVRPRRSTISAFGSSTRPSPCRCSTAATGSASRTNC